MTTPKDEAEKLAMQIARKLSTHARNEASSQTVEAIIQEHLEPLFAAIEAFRMVLPDDGVTINIRGDAINPARQALSNLKAKGTE